METLGRTISPLPDAKRGTVVAVTALLVLITVLFCLIPKAENDLFFILRTGTDILHTGRLPHTDMYSWTRFGVRWDVPEWGAFVLYALAFGVGGFLGTWVLMTLLTLAAVGLVWGILLRRVGVAWAFFLTCLMLVVLNPVLQERPYAFTYLLLAGALLLLGRGRTGQRGALIGLVPLCIVWTNLHQGVLAFVGLILAYAVGDGLTMLWRRWEEASAPAPDLLTPEGQERARRVAENPDGWRRHASRALAMLGTALACAGAALCSPYGVGVYRNVWVTLHDHTLMANVTEWNPVSVLPVTELEPFGLAAVLVFGSLAVSRRRNLADALVLAALFVEALLHARNMALFAVGGMVIAAPHFASALEEWRRLRGGAKPLRRGPLLGVLAVVFAGGVALVAWGGLRRSVGPRGFSAAGIGEAVAKVPGYPSRACAFMDAEGFPSGLRMLNDFETGGYLMWRLPREVVSVDGRLDVYVGRTFDDMVTLARRPASPAGAALVRQYNFDIVFTTRSRVAQAFAADPSHWTLVYADPPGPHSQHARIFLRRRPTFAALIARCQHDQPM
jgi:hypothetical protein